MPSVPDQEPETTSYQRNFDWGLFRDPLLQYRPAGKSTSIFDDTSTKDLQSEIYFPAPPTPPRERRFRKNLIPGEICVHYGLHEQQLPPPSFAYGCRTEKGESAERTFKAGQKFGIDEYKNRCAEMVYESNRMEPLGKCHVRGHSLPPYMSKPEFQGHGAPHPKLGVKQDGKEVIFPRDARPDPEHIRKQYQFTHGNWAAGEMVNRNYNWPAETKGEHFRFGKAEDYEGDGEKGGSASALNWDLDARGKKPVTRIGRITLQDYRDVAHEKLGQHRNYMQGNVFDNVPKGWAFGIRSKGANDTAAACLGGDATLESQFPDHDLGRCAVPGKRNVPKAGDEHRKFGCPSVRTDIVAPERRSVADTQNYGNEVGAHALLNPQRFQMQGIEDKEFLLRREKEKLRSILKGAGFELENFDSLWEQALTLFDDDLPLVSLDAIFYLHGAEIEKKVEEKVRAGLLK